MKSPEAKANFPHKKGQTDHIPGAETKEKSPSKGAGADVTVQPKTRRLSQFSKDVPNLGHSHSSHTHQQGHGHGHDSHGHHAHHGHHHHHHHEHGERPHRRISHHSHTSDGTKGEAGHDRQHRGGHHKHHGRARAGSKREHDRHSVATSGEMNTPIEYENTYRLEPDAVFMPAKVKAIIKAVLEENLKGQTYQANLMASRCMALSDIIKERIRQQVEMPRFKTVVLVLVGENKAQALSVASQCLWNKATDNYASCEYSKGNLHVVAMVFYVYQE